MSKTITYYNDIMFHLLDHQLVMIKDSGCFDKSIKDCIRIELQNPIHNHGRVTLHTACVADYLLIVVFKVTFDSQTHNRLKLTAPQYLSTLTRYDMKHRFFHNAGVETHGIETDVTIHDGVNRALKEAGYA